MSAYEAAHLDEIVAEKWPYWAPIRHHFDIRAFGANAWRGGAGDEAIKRHAEEEGGHCIFIREPQTERVGFATEANTVVLTIGGWAGKAFEPSDWETESFAS